MIRTVKYGTLEYLTAEGFSVPHCFTTRFGGVSTGIFDSLNIGMHRGDTPENVEKNYAIMADALDFDLNQLVLTHQVHSDIVRRVTKQDAQGLDHHLYPECDALITADPGTALAVFTADCTPSLLHDPVTAADIAGKTVRTMRREFGCDPKNIRAAIGPNISACCFACDADVPEAMVRALGNAALKHIRQQDDKYYVNLKEINAQFLRNAGVHHIEISTACTMCESHRFWSHRVTKGDRGSQGAFILCKGGSL